LSSAPPDPLLKNRARLCTQLAMVVARPGLASQSGSSRPGTDVQTKG
jgi:hypothetical protein